MGMVSSAEEEGIARIFHQDGANLAARCGEK